MTRHLKLVLVILLGSLITLVPVSVVGTASWSEYSDSSCQYQVNIAAGYIGEIGNIDSTGACSPYYDYQLQPGSISINCSADGSVHFRLWRYNTQCSGTPSQTVGGGSSTTPNTCLGGSGGFGIKVKCVEAVPRNRVERYFYLNAGCNDTAIYGPQLSQLDIGQCRWVAGNSANLRVTSDSQWALTYTSRSNYYCDQSLVQTIDAQRLNVCQTESNFVITPGLPTTFYTKHIVPNHDSLSSSQIAPTSWPPTSSTHMIKYHCFNKNCTNDCWPIQATRLGGCADTSGQYASSERYVCSESGKVYMKQTFTDNACASPISSTTFNIYPAGGPSTSCSYGTFKSCGTIDDANYQVHPAAALPNVGEPLVGFIYYNAAPCNGAWTYANLYTNSSCALLSPGFPYIDHYYQSPSGQIYDATYSGSSCAGTPEFTLPQRTTCPSSSPYTVWTLFTNGVSPGVANSSGVATLDLGIKTATLASFSQAHGNCTLCYAEDILHPRASSSSSSTGATSAGGTGGTGSGTGASSTTGGTSTSTTTGVSGSMSSSSGGDTGSSDHSSSSGGLDPERSAAATVVCHVSFTSLISLVFLAINSCMV